MFNGGREQPRFQQSPAQNPLRPRAVGVKLHGGGHFLNRRFQPHGTGALKMLHLRGPKGAGGQAGGSGLGFGQLIDQAGVAGKLFKRG